ncbi:Fic family protein [Ligilactobacillus murinus]|uniref:Fic family protein n=1 Tax=Ligilactobacillus murinus TaxID=1622 RepID=UPI00138EDA8F|nr:Fic family protein [Ligilactobacillus murinus]NDO25546.1 Fic family protein [Ligilactobacillus murinus]
MRPPFSITDKMLKLTVEITQAVTLLELQHQRDLHLRKENRIRSIHSSLAIEQNTLSLEQVTAIIAGKRVLGEPKEIREVQNAYEAYEEVFKFDPYSIENLLAAHRLMTKGLVKESGAFRERDVGVYDGNGTVVHIGARPQFVYGLVDDLFKWAKKTDIPALIKSCVVHFELEMIHPFLDGNGRMGRLWQNLLLAKWQPVFEWIPIETLIYKHQKQYYELLAVGDHENDSTKFIEFMLEIILEASLTYSKHTKQAGLDDRIKRLREVEQKFFAKIYPTLRYSQGITTSKAAELTGKTQSTTRRYLLKLVSLDVLEAVGKNKDRHYVLKDTGKH